MPQQVLKMWSQHQKIQIELGRHLQMLLKTKANTYFLKKEKDGLLALRQKRQGECTHARTRTQPRGGYKEA